jgi:hypothetical protein
MSQLVKDYHIQKELKVFFKDKTPKEEETNKTIDSSFKILERPICAKTLIGEFSLHEEVHSPEPNGTGYTISEIKESIDLVSQFVSNIEKLFEESSNFLRGNMGNLDGAS